MTELIYLVVQEGVYRHDIMGAFFNENDAAVLAEALADSDKDDWHSYDVIRLPIGMPSLQDIKLDTEGWENCKEEYLYGYRKEKERIAQTIPDTTFLEQIFQRKTNQAK